MVPFYYLLTHSLIVFNILNDTMRYCSAKRPKKAAEVTMGIMMAPSILGILTDFCGIVFIAIAPVKAMDNHAIFCGMWALWIVPTGTFYVLSSSTYLLPPTLEISLERTKSNPAYTSTKSAL